MAHKYQLRYAAGLYWLVCTNQCGSDYRKPVPINEVGAFIWQRLQEGDSEEAVAARLRAAYAIEDSQAREDVAHFLNQLLEHGIENP